MIVATQYPGVPVVTSMAIIALGATDVTASRFRGSMAALPIMVLHGMTYLLVYALFVGARLHLPTLAPTSRVSFLALLDLATSAFPMTVALSRIWSCLRHSLLSRP